jgi:hypothetical protein
MKTKKNIHIIGGSLYGCFLAYFFSKKKKYKVFLIENSSTLVNSLNSIEIKNMKLNNGYHIFELPRSVDVVNFFKKKIGIKFKYSPSSKKLLINNHIIDSDKKLEEWPEKLKKKVNLKKNFYDEKQNINSYFKKDLTNLIKKNSLRFSDKFSVSKKNFLPYFLPADVTHKSKESGMVFRDKLKRLKINSKVAAPEKILFSSFQKPLENFLKKRSVTIMFNTNVSFKNKKIEYYYKDNKIDLIDSNTRKIFFCMNSVLMLKDIYPKYIKELGSAKRFFYNCLVKFNHKEKLNYFSEILCVNKKLPFMNRISFFGNIPNKSKNEFIQIELYSKKEINISKTQKLIIELKKIFKLKNIPKLVGVKMTRLIYLLEQRWIKKSSAKCKKWINLNEKKIVTKLDFTPININKQWLYAKKDYEKYF